jgi:recombination associated protein RdgC
MGLFGGSVSTTKFYVRGALPKRFVEPFVKAIRLRAFQELQPDDEQDERAGWCVAGKPLDLELLAENTIVNSYLLLGLRIDKWRIPRSLFKAHFDEAAAAHLAKTGKERLSKKEKEELKFRVNRKLRRKVLPTMRNYDLCWDFNRGELRFWNRSARVNDDLRAVFEQTFGSFELTLDEDSPYLAATLVLPPERAERLMDIEQTSFVASEA